MTSTMPESVPAADAAALGLKGIHHVAIIASDYERSKWFYTEVLCLPVVHEQYRAERQSHKLDLQLPDGTQLELFSFPSPAPRPSYPEACGLRHLALRVADLGASLRWLAAQGVVAEPVRTDVTTGAAFTFIADPDGLPIELVEVGAPVASVASMASVT